MTMPSAISVAPHNETETATDRHIRGSSLLLAGRFLALALNFAAQVLVVRYLSKSDYGSLAYALAVVNFCATLAAFGMDKSAGRYIPIYKELRDHDTMFGALAFMFLLILGAGGAFALALFGLRGLVFDHVVSNPKSVELLLVVIALAPVQALDELFVSLFAVFTGARAIFWRKHVLGPCLKLVAVLAVVMLRGDVRALAVAHLAAGVLGTSIYGVALVQVLKRQGHLRQFSLSRLRFPAKVFLGFGLPLLASDLALVLRGTLTVMLLEHFHGSETVAAYQAVVPVARLNTVVRASFTFLFMPAAVRLLMRDDRKGLDDLYWKSAIWITLLTLPVFAVTFALSDPLTLVLFGHRYAGSGFLLAFLSFGQFFNSSLGLNALMLRVYGRVRYIITVDAIMTVLTVAMGFLVIPRWGAPGAAIGTCCIYILQALLDQMGLWRGTGVHVVNNTYVRLYAGLTAATVALLIFQRLVAPPFPVGVALAAVASLAVLAANGRLLDLHGTFPELARLPLLRRFVGQGGRAS